MAGRSEGGWKHSWRRRVTGKSVQQGRMEEAPENGKESSHSAHANGMNECIDNVYIIYVLCNI